MNLGCGAGNSLNHQIVNRYAQRTRQPPKRLNGPVRRPASMSAMTPKRAVSDLAVLRLFKYPSPFGHFGVANVNTLTRSALARHLGVSRTTLWNYENRGLIPAPDRVGGNRSLFGPAAIMAAESAVFAAKAVA